MPRDPWSSIARPPSESAITALRVDEHHPWDFFWGKDSDGKCLLVFRHTSLSNALPRTPQLRELEVKHLPRGNVNQDTLMIRLVDADLRDVFLTLCEDVVAATLHAANEVDAFEIALRRTWRWHHLLRGGSDARLSSEEQKGLIGELLVLERYLLPTLTAIDAVDSWIGPRDAPKDFQVGTLCIEAKARRGSATAEISISSENQLDTSGIDRLFLHVVNLAKAPEEGGGFSISDIATRIRDAIRKRDPLAADSFDDRLEAAGLNLAHDYSDSLWLEGESWAYRVHEDFPRIEASTLSSGVSRVRYSISLNDCESHRCDAAELTEALLELNGHGE